MTDREVCPNCHKFQRCICPPGPEASEAAKRAHEAYERALAKILRGATP